MASQSNIVSHVPSRARGIEQISEYVKSHDITNEMLIKIGLRINGNLLFGSNQRCVAMLIVFKSLMDDIKPQPQQSINQQEPSLDLTTSPGVHASPGKGMLKSSEKPLVMLQNRLNEALEFLDFCRPLSVSMTNAAKLMKGEILKLDQSHTDEAIAKLRHEIDQIQVNDDDDHHQQDDNKDEGITAKGLARLDLSELKEDDNQPIGGTKKLSNSRRGSMSATATKQIIPSTRTRTSSRISISDEWQVYEQQKEELKKFIDRFIDEEIWSAQKGICENIFTNIANNDVILVYGCSTIVQHVLLHAKTRGKRFKVIVVDSPPHFNGRRMISFLNDSSIDAAYTLINSLSFVMRMTTKVLLGANSMLANGYVMSHIGTSQVALMAKESNVPTLVCCETYRLSDRVYVDSFGCNEVDSGSHELDQALNLRYDLTPPEFVSMVINERNTVPPNSIPALLRFRAERIRDRTTTSTTNTASHCNPHSNTQLIDHNQKPRREK